MKSLIRFFEESVEKYGDNVYLWEMPEDHYVGTTYREARQQVRDFAAGLMALGIEKGDRIGLISEGRNSWVIGEMGILHAGAISVPLSTKLHAEEVKFRINHSESRMIIVSSLQAAKVKEVLKDCPALEKIIYLDSQKTYLPNEIYFDDVKQLGRRWLENPANGIAFDAISQGVLPSDPANICYTSGTSADPKGIVLSHGNYVTNVYQALSLMDIPQAYKTLLILPWDHSFGHTCGIYTFMAAGASLASVKTGKTSVATLRNLSVCMKAIKPNLIMSVPAIAKNFRKNIEKGIKDRGGLTERLFNHALKIAYAYNKEGWNKGRGLTKLYKPLLLLYDRLFFAKVREAYGGELDCFIGGGALLDIELQRFFYALGIPMFQGYGLSEAAPVISSNSMDRHRLGSSGVLVSNLALKICDGEGNELQPGEKGEIVIRGGNIMLGYWKNEAATREAIRDGWLHTGDMGYITDDGYLYVLGRFKSLLIADDGEKFSPEGIEEAITEQSPFIDQLMLYNNQKPYTVALLVPNRPALKAYLREKNLTGDADAASKAVLELIERELAEYGAGGRFGNIFPPRWLPSAVAILEDGFTEENGLMNSTLKIVRGKIIDRYQKLIDDLYTPEAKNFANKRNRLAIDRLLHPA